MTYTRFSALSRKSAMDILSSRILNNFVVTRQVINYCHSVGIKAYRLSSNIVPILNHPEVNLKLVDLPNFDIIKNEIDRIKNDIILTNMRVSAHPSEYISLTSLDDSVISNSIRDLESHGEIFDLLNLPKNYNSPLNIHCRQDGDAVEISDRFARNFDKLSDSIKSRLVLENNDNPNGVWHISNLIKHFHNKIKTPITYDVLHHNFCNGGDSHVDAFNAAYETWNTVPLFHYSEGVDGTRKHADFACQKPNSFGKNVYWDVELKSKDLAILKILNS